MKMQSAWITLFLITTVMACNKSGFKGSSATENLVGNTTETTVPGSVDEAFSGPNAVTDSIIISKNVDLVIALDASGSMNEERAAVSANLNKMILALQQGSLDPRIHLIAGGRNDDDDDDDVVVPPKGPAFPFPADVDGTKVALIPQRIGSHDALRHVSQLLSGAYAARYQTVQGTPMNPPMALRPEAKLEVLVITDDNGTGPGSTAKDFDPTNQWKATVSGVIGTPTSAQAVGVCRIAAVGQEYITLATQTGGTIIDICSPDWSVIIDRFTKDVLKRSQSIQLSKEPIDAEKLVVTFGGTVLPREAWTYDASTRQVTLAATVAVEPGKELKVNYEAKP
jgi:hypothetical protein